MKNIQRNFSLANDIVLRSKAKKYLTTPELIQKVQECCFIMSLKTVDEILFLLWIMTYDFENAMLSLFNISTQPTYMYDVITQPICVTTDTLKYIRNEIRFQCENVHSNLFELPFALETESNYAYTQLLNKAGGSAESIIAYKVAIMCKRYILNNGADAEYNSTLLTSKNIKKNYGALRKMGFSELEAEFLKPYCKEIGELLHYMNTDFLNASVNSDDSPYVYDKFHSYISNPINLNSLTIEAFAQDEKYLMPFIMYYNILYNHGYDPKTIIEKASIISKTFEN